jgi:hypothetical protein
MNTTLIQRINLKDLEATLSKSTTVLAVVGAGDLALEKLMAAREDLTGRAAAFDPKTFRDQAQDTIASGVGVLQTELQAAPEQLRALPETAQEWPTRAQSLVADLLSAAFALYGELVGRGTHRVTQVREATPEAVDLEVDVTPVSRPKTSTARKSSSSATTSSAKRSTTKSAGSTAKKSSAAKSSAAKSSAAKPSAAKSATSSSPESKDAESKGAESKDAESNSAGAATTTPESSSS